MSFPWGVKHKVKSFETPSPTLQLNISDIISRKTIGCVKLSMEKISLFISKMTHKALRGSMTVEASLLLPLVIFFFLHLLGIIEMLRLHGNLTLGLWNCGNTLAVYQAIPEQAIENVPDMAVSYLYVKNQVEKFLGEEYLQQSPLVQGADGLLFLNSAYGDGYVDIGVTYEVKPPISIFPFPYMRMVNRYYGKDWSGYEINESLRYVYITIYGEVWHARADCSHIFITVLETDWNSIKGLRNEKGGKYYLCELCEAADKGEKVYYTPHGNRYHKDRECSSLVRYVQAILWQENLSYSPCSRCVEREDGVW